MASHSWAMVGDPSLCNLCDKGLSPRPGEKYESMRKEEIVVKNVTTSMLQRSIYTVSWVKMEKSNCYGTEPALPLWLVSTPSRLGDREVGREERQKKKDKAPISVRQFCLCRGKSQRQVSAILRSFRGSLTADQLPSREKTIFPEGVTLDIDGQISNFPPMLQILCDTESLMHEFSKLGQQGDSGADSCVPFPSFALPLTCPTFPFSGCPLSGTCPSKKSVDVDPGGGADSVEGRKG